MAIVNRSKRDTSLANNSTGPLGPGEYEKDALLQQEIDKFNSSRIMNKNNVELIIPFNSTAQRKMILRQSGSTPNFIGPGSYFNENSFIKKSFNCFSPENNNNPDNFMNIVVNNLLKKKKETEKMDKEYLKIDSKNGNEVIKVLNNKNLFQSPTNLTHNRSFSNTTDTKKNIIKIIPTTNTLLRVNSIPYKNNLAQGYFYDNSGRIFMMPNIDENGEKTLTSEETGGNMNNNNSLIKKIGALDWSKMSMKSDLRSERLKLLEKYKPKLNFEVRNTKFGKDTEEKGIGASQLITGSVISNGVKINLKRDKTMKAIRTMSRFGKTCLKKGLNTKESSDLTSLDESKIVGKDTKRKIGKSSSCIDFSIKSKGDLDNKKTKGKLFLNYLDHKKGPKKKNMEDIILNNLYSVLPGPGYYPDKSGFEKSGEIPLFSKNFGSNSERYNKRGVSIESTFIGPGSYFKESPKSDFKPMFYPFSRKEIIIDNDKLLNNIISRPTIFSSIEETKLSPASYNIKSQFDIKNKNYTGSQEKRFFGSYKSNGFPGPNAYGTILDWSKNINKNNLPRKIMELLKEKVSHNNDSTESKEQREKEHEKDVEKRYSYIPKIDSPKIGRYNPDIVKSIEYKVNSNINHYTSFFAPFYTGQERFAPPTFTTPEILGPGSFNLRKREPKINDIKEEKESKGLAKPANKNSERILEKYKKENELEKQNLGPAYYNNTNSGAWNKRSFNILYL